MTFGSLDGGYFVDANTGPAQMQTLTPDGSPLTIVGDLNNADDLVVVIRTRDPVGEETGSKVLLRDEDFSLTGNTI